MPWTAKTYSGRATAFGARASASSRCLESSPSGAAILWCRSSTKRSASACSPIMSRHGESSSASAVSAQRRTGIMGGLLSRRSNGLSTSGHRQSGQGLSGRSSSGLLSSTHDKKLMYQVQTGPDNSRLVHAGLVQSRQLKTRNSMSKKKQKQKRSTTNSVTRRARWVPAGYYTRSELQSFLDDLRLVGEAMVALEDADSPLFLTSEVPGE